MPSVAPAITASYRNHLQVNSAAESKWGLKIGAALRQPVEWRAELTYAATQIWQMISHHNIMKATLYADGSYASQLMLQAFHWAQVPFETVIPRFAKDLNIQAISTCVNLLEQEKISYRFIEVDIEAFLQNENTKNLAKKFNTSDPNQILAMHIWEQNSFMVFPFGISKLIKTNEGWKVQESESDYAILRFQAESQSKGVPHFFHWSPELILAFLNDLHLRAIVMNLVAATTLDDFHLREIFQRYFSVMGRKNWNGFEKLTFQVKKFQSGLQIKNDKYSFSYADFCHQLEKKPKIQSQAG